MMKNLKTVLFSMLAGAMMCACSSDKLGNEPDPVLPPDDGEGVYMALNIQMPNGALGSRSETGNPNENGTVSTGGTEIGSDAENTVTNALIVLAASQQVASDLPKYGFIAASEVQNNRISDLSSSEGKVYRAMARVQKTNLNSFYERFDGTTGTAPEVYVFVFCNPTKELTDMFADKDFKFGSTMWIDAACTVIQGNPTQPNQNIGIWGANSFLMNNVSLTTRELPATLLEWENYNSYEKAFHLSEANPNSVDNGTSARGPIRVERSVARFDFRDASPLREDGKPATYNTYNVLFVAGADGTANEAAPLVMVQLQKMCLVNMSNSFYYIPRVSDDGLLDGPNYQLCGVEKPWTRVDGKYVAGNYVVGPYCNEFGGSVIRTGFDAYFNYPFFENDGSFNNNAMTSDRWDVVKIDDVIENNAVNDNYHSPNGTYSPGDYKVWRYVTENVIPVDPEKQVNGISTGIVFKAQIKGSPKVDNSSVYEGEYWNKPAAGELGYAQNLAACLNGEQFTYNGKKTTIQGNSHLDPILYYYSGTLYMGWRNMRQAAIQAAVTVNAVGQVEINRSNSLYKAVFGDGPISPEYTYYSEVDGKEDIKTVKTVFISADGKAEPLVDPMWSDDESSAAYKSYMKSADYAWAQWNGEGKPVGGDGTSETVPAELTAFRKAVTEGGVTIFQSSLDNGETPGYYCYYYYWNRHNDNNIPGVMGPMEFDVVRNNVYKLSVESISRLGHPRIPDNDPDNPKPEYPDESDLIYLDVKVTIAPWAVRVNNITF